MKSAERLKNEKLNWVFQKGHTKIAGGRARGSLRIKMHNYGLKKNYPLDNSFLLVIESRSGAGMSGGAGPSMARLEDLKHAQEMWYKI